MARALSHINASPMIHVPSRRVPNTPLLSPLPYRPMTVTMSYVASVNADIEAHLKQTIPMKDPLSVYQPMHHLAFAAPWDTAPALCVAACELVGGNRDLALSAASALHLMHAAAFTHEHVQLSETSSLSLSLKPTTVHHAYGPNIELLVADAMIPFGMGLLAKSDDPAHDMAGRILRVMGEITWATGSEGTIYGQYEEIEIRKSKGGDSDSLEVGEIESVCEKYEGAFHACAAACGAILGGGSEEEIEKMRKFGVLVGKIQGAEKRMEERTEEELKKVVEKLRNSALKELEGLNEAKAEAVSGFVEVNLVCT